MEGKKMLLQNKKLAPKYVGLIQGTTVFLIVTICVCLLSLQSYRDQKKDFLGGVLKLTNHAASLVDMDLHQQLQYPDQTDSELYRELIYPLVRFHNSFPEIYYLYTIVEKDDKRFFILDTANSELLESYENLTPSHVMEEYDDSEVSSDWLEAVRAGNAIIDQEPFTDEFGTFISGSVPLYDSQENYAGILGIDIEVDTYYARRNRIIINLFVICFLALIVSIILGILIYRNETYLYKLRQVEHELIMTDSLTGAFNRRFYSEILKKEWSRYKRYGDNFSCALIDIDYFKKVNDTYGHDVGDQVLVNTVKLISTELRESDFLIRMGGEEFLVFMPNTTEKGAVILAERVRKSIENTSIILSNNESTHITASVGVSCVIETDTKEDPSKRADMALYQAKESGRNRVVAAGQMMIEEPNGNQ
jgi:diguanylate cyclase (GGDEF)-like protein